MMEVSYLLNDEKKSTLFNLLHSDQITMRFVYTPHSDKKGGGLILPPLIPPLSILLGHESSL